MGSVSVMYSHRRARVRRAGSSAHLASSRAILSLRQSVYRYKPSVALRQQPERWSATRVGVLPYSQLTLPSAPSISCGTSRPEESRTELTRCVPERDAPVTSSG